MRGLSAFSWKHAIATYTGFHRRSKMRRDRDGRLEAVAGNIGNSWESRRDVLSVDLDGVVRRLILFDKYILKSIQLQEFPFLIAAMGFDGTMQLLESPALDIEFECVTIGQTGQTRLESRLKKGILPPLSYSLSGVETTDHRELVHHWLQPLHRIPGLAHKQVLRLKRAIVGKIVRLPEGFRNRMLIQARTDVLAKPHLVRKSVEMAARQILKADPGDFSMLVHAIDSEDVRIETDLPNKMGIDIRRPTKLSSVAYWQWAACHNDSPRCTPTQR